ncbi:MAG: DnaT-like ssDNA-binding protein [Bacteroidota bacterium]
MTSLVVEDGSGVVGANTYISEVDCDTYCEDRGLTAWASLTSDQKVAAIFRAMEYIESLQYKGQKSDTDHSLKWPRVYVFTEDSYLLDSDEIPEDLRKAVARGAYEESQSAGCLASTLARSSFTKREKVGQIEVEYDSFNYESVFRNIENLLKDLISVKADLLRV